MVKSDIEIFEQPLLVKNGVTISKLAILRGGLNSDNPTAVMNNAVKKYVGNNYYNEFVDIRMDNPWTRVIISGINELRYLDFNENYKLILSRIEKLDSIVGDES